MPNHVLSKIAVTNPDVIKALQSANAKIDFNQIIPSPEIFNEFGGMVPYLGSDFDEFLDFLKSTGSYSQFYGKRQKLREFIQNYATNKGINNSEKWELQAYSFILTGCSDPLEWNREHWGTKWNAYEVEMIDDTHFNMQTAWSFPFPIIFALSQKFPNETISVAYADEDAGYNCGEFTIKNGQIEWAISEENTDREELTRWACDHWGFDCTDEEECEDNE